VILYRNNLKNPFVTASALSHNFRSHSRLASRQWTLAPNKNSEEPLCHIPDSSGCFGIDIITIPLTIVDLWRCGALQTRNHL
jgi:hypothetical protein